MIFHPFNDFLTVFPISTHRRLNFTLLKIIIQIMMGTGPQCYFTSFKVIRLVVPEKKKFEVVFTIYWRGGQLGHVTQLPQTNIMDVTHALWI